MLGYYAGSFFGLTGGANTSIEGKQAAIQSTYEMSMNTPQSVSPSVLIRALMHANALHSLKQMRGEDLAKVRQIVRAQEGRDSGVARQIVGQWRAFFGQLDTPAVAETEDERVCQLCGNPGACQLRNSEAVESTLYCEACVQSICGLKMESVADEFGLHGPMGWYYHQTCMSPMTRAVVNDYSCDGGVTWTALPRLSREEHRAAEESYNMERLLANRGVRGRAGEAALDSGLHERWPTRQEETARQDRLADEDAETEAHHAHMTAFLQALPYDDDSRRRMRRISEEAALFLAGLPARMAERAAAHAVEHLAEDAERAEREAESMAAFRVQHAAERENQRAYDTDLIARMMYGRG
jgi:hypothetical protein